MAGDVIGLRDGQQMWRRQNGEELETCGYFGSDWSNDCNLEKHVSFRSLRYATARGGGGASFRENQKLGTQLFRLALLFVFPFRPSVTELPS